MKNKKGALVFAPLLLILMVWVLIHAYSEISARYKEFNKEIGEKQFELINTYKEGEKALFYIDQSAKYSAYRGIYDLAKNGGCISGNVYGNYRLWTVDGPKQGVCFPSAQDSKNGFFDFFSNNLNSYLSAYKPLALPLNNYGLSFNGTTLVGIAKEPLKVPIIEDISNKGLGIYSIKAPFKVNMGNYDFSDYDALRLEAQEFVNACNNRAPYICIDEKKPYFFDGAIKLQKCPSGAPETKLLDYVWDSDVRYSVYGLCANKTNKPLVYTHDSEDNSFGYKNVVYKFALPFQDLKCTLKGHQDLIDTKCVESSCSNYYDCKDAAPLCYCASGTGNACQGACLPFCSEYTGPLVPPQLGQPDANVIYKYTASGATPIWYRHIGNGNWQWTPYDPYPTPKCWMPVAETIVSNSCGGKWDGQKPAQANIDIINYLNVNKPIPPTTSLITDPDVDTACTDFSCSSYLSCNAIDTCGCSATAKACKGNDCQTLHCSRDSEFESKTGINAACKDQCSKYGDCSATNLCACDSGLSACQGSCYCNPGNWESTGGCGTKREDGVQCNWNEIPQKREYSPKTCSSPDYRCEPQPESVCPKPTSSPVPVPTPTPTPIPTPTPPADDSCQGRCGSQAPSGCWCDPPSDTSKGCEFYGDCCSDFSQYC